MYYSIIKMDNIPKKLLNVGEKQFLKKNDVLIHSGELVNYAYVLLKGKVLVYYDTVKGSLYSDLILAPCIIGEEHVICQKEMVGTFKCLENSEVIKISRKILLDLMKTDFDINIFIYKKVAYLFDQTGLKLETYSSLPSEKRVILFLIELADLLGIEMDGKIKIDLNISQQFISNFVSVERTSTVNAFNKLKAKHILEYYDGYYYISDLESLKKMVW